MNITELEPIGFIVVVVNVVAVGFVVPLTGPLTSARPLSSSLRGRPKRQAGGDLLLFRLVVFCQRPPSSSADWVGVGRS